MLYKNVSNNLFIKYMLLLKGSEQWRFGNVQPLGNALREDGGDWFCYKPLQKNGGGGSYKLYCYATVIRKMINKISYIIYKIEETECFCLRI